MNRRQFLQVGAASSGLVLSGTGQPAPAEAFTASGTKRVGLIGCGLVRQVRPVAADPGRPGRGRLALRRRQATCSPRPPRSPPTARRRRRSRAPTATTARCSSEKDLDIVLIATPDHWHALPMIAAVEAGADVYVQKPISVDVVEGQAMLAAARKHGRVVQVGTQRRSTPHLIEARDRFIKEGKLGKIGLVEIYCYYHMRNRGNPPDTARRRIPRLRDVDRPGPDAAVQPDRPPARLAGVHGVRQRHRRRHVHPHARHGPLDARPGLAEAGRLDRRHPRRQGEQGQHLRHADRHLRLRRPETSSGSIAPGASRPTRSIPGAPRSTATRARSR